MSNSQQPALTTLNIATRQSPLALWQAEHIRDRLLALYPNLTINLLKIVTKGDKILDTPLAKIGGKGLFVKELEQAMYDKQADIAVHSLKDVPMQLPEGLMLECTVNALPQRMRLSLTLIIILMSCQRARW